MISKQYDKFNIWAGEPIKADSRYIPEDPLNEFNEFEMGLKWYCCEHNHYIILEVGDLKVDNIQLFPHVLSALEAGLLKYSKECKQGQKLYFDFSEDKSLLATRDKDAMICQLYGKTYQVKYSEFIKKFNSFFDGVLIAAIQKNYINADDAKKEIGWNPQSSKTLELKKFSSTSLFDENY